MRLLVLNCEYPPIGGGASPLTAWGMARFDHIPNTPLRLLETVAHFMAFAQKVSRQTICFALRARRLGIAHLFAHSIETHPIGRR